MTKERNGVRVLFDNVPAPLLYVSAGRIDAITPFSLNVKFPAFALVQIENSGGTLQLYIATASAAPVVFDNGIFNEDGSHNSVENPAPSGALLVLYGTGLGQTNPPGVDGAIAQLPASSVAPVLAQFGNVSAEVVYAGPALGMLSAVFQISIRIPAGLSAGKNLLSIGEGKVVSGVDVFTK